MTAYGLAFISILWSRLDFVASTPMLRNVHHMVIIGICALPLVLALPQKVRVGMTLRDRGGVPHWPPYYAPALNSKTSGLKGWVTDKQVVFSDQPWAVAWYADRDEHLAAAHQGWLHANSKPSPPTSRRRPSASSISPSSHGSGPISEVDGQIQGFRRAGARRPGPAGHLSRRVSRSTKEARKSRKSPSTIPTASRWSAWTWCITVNAPSASTERASNE